MMQAAQYRYRDDLSFLPTVLPTFSATNRTSSFQPLVWAEIFIPGYVIVNQVSEMSFMKDDYVVQ